MSQETFIVILLLTPLVVGGLIAAINASQINHLTEAAEARAREWRSRTSERTGSFTKYVLKPLLWSIVTFCDWTDGFVHRGAKNGTRVAATLYLIGLWLLVLYAAVIVIIAIVILVVGLYIAAKVLGGSSGTSEVTYTRTRSRQVDDEVMDQVGLRGKKVYRGTNWFNEELKGRIDDEGNLYRGSHWFNEEKIGRIDDDGNIYSGTSVMTEEKVGRIDNDGTLYKGTNWFSEERTGRIDQDGTIHKGTNWFNEEKQGRAGD